MKYELYHLDSPAEAVEVDALSDKAAADKVMDALCDSAHEAGIYRLSRRVYDEDKAVAQDHEGGFYNETVREYRVNHDIGFVGSYAPGEIPLAD